LARHVALATKTHAPVLLEADFAELEVAVPWWEGRRLRFIRPAEFEADSLTEDRG